MDWKTFFKLHRAELSFVLRHFCRNVDFPLSDRLGQTQCNMQYNTSTPLHIYLTSPTLTCSYCLWLLLWRGWRWSHRSRIYHHWTIHYCVMWYRQEFSSRMHQCWNDQFTNSRRVWFCRSIKVGEVEITTSCSERSVKSRHITSNTCTLTCTHTHTPDETADLLAL